MTESPEGTLIRMQDGSVRVKRGGQWAPVNPSFAAPTRATPDPMAARAEYGKGVAAIAADRKAYNSYGALPAQLDRFSYLNTRGEGGQATGSLWNQAFKDRTLFGEQDPELGAMQAISSSIQTRGIPQGQGSITEMERKLFATGSPRVENIGPVNQQIITNMKGTYQEEGDRLEFADAYLAANGTMNGSSEAWSQYVRDNPYTVPAGASVRPNAKRAPWRQYFGLQSAPAAPPTRPTVPPAARSAYDARVKAGRVDTSKPRGDAANPFVAADMETAYRLPRGSYVILPNGSFGPSPSRAATTAGAPRKASAAVAPAAAAPDPLGIRGR